MLVVRFCSCVLFFSAIVGIAQAQLLSVDNTTAPPVQGVGHDYIKMLGETVSPANGSVSLRIDIPLPPGRGFKIPFAVLYNSSGVMRVGGKIGGGGTFYDDSAAYEPAMGWNFSVPSISAVQATTSVYNSTAAPPVTYSCVYISGYNFSDWSGATQPLNLSIAQSTGSTNGCDLVPSKPGNYLVDQDDFYQAFTTNSCTNCIPTFPNPVQVVDAEGTVYTSGAWAVDGAFNQYSSPQSPSYPQQYNTGYWGMVSSMEDRNGNILTVGTGTNCGSNCRVIHDDVGRQVVTISGNAGSMSVAVLGQSASYTLLESTTGVNFSVNPTIISTDPSVCRGIDTSGLGVSNPTVSTVQTITLPNGKNYQFHYDPYYGLLNKITYPDGGYVQYTWGLNPQSEIVQLPQVPQIGDNQIFASCFVIYDKPAITQRTVSYDGTNVAEIQNYSYNTTMQTSGSSQWTSKTTTVTTYDMVRSTSFQTVYTYTPIFAQTGPDLPSSGAPAQIALEKSVVHKDFSGTVLRTDYKGWGGQSGQLLNCDLTKLDSGSISGAWYTYGPGGQITDKKEYDYGLIGSGPCFYPAPSSPTRETVTAYQTFPPTLIYPNYPSIVDKPSSTKVYNGGASGSPMAESDYFYDGTAVGSVSSPTGHDDTNYGTGYNNRGNLTKKTVKCIGCSDAVTSYTYDLTGQRLSMTDPCGNGTCTDMATGSHTTTYSYSDSYTVLSSGSNVSYTSSGNTNAYLTKITDPLGHFENFTYDYNTGQLTILKDQNGQSTNYLYNDPFFRPTQINYPDGGQTAYSYNDSAFNASTPSPSVTGTTLISSGVNRITTKAFDGFEHTLKTILSSDPDGITYSDTTYDGLGLPYTVSNPYRTTSDSTYGISIYGYDALGRTTQLTMPDGSVTSTLYSGNATTVTDPVGNQRLSVSDGLGRLIQVQEPGVVSPATPGSGSIAVSGSEQSTTSGATSGNGTVTINGSENSTVYYPCGTSSCPTTVWDTGYVTITVNGFAASINYSQPSTSSGLAGALVAALNVTSSPVTAVLSGSVITMTAKATGASTDYSLSATSATTQTGYFMYPSFTGVTSGSTLIGGKNAGTLYDTGTVSVSVNGFAASVSYSQTVNNTPTLIASSLATAFSGSGSPVGASSSDGTLTLTANAGGAGTNYSVSSSSTDTSGYFAHSSFSATSTTLTGGTSTNELANPLNTLYTYDVLNNLTCAVQKGTDSTRFTTCAAASSFWRPRLFVYDSLSRLTSATNPESGNITYQYDLNSNLSSRVAPKPGQTGTATVATNYSYDVLNRLTTKTYVGLGTSKASYFYDGGAVSGCNALPVINSPTNLIGRRSAACSSSNISSVYSYDPMGRPLFEKTSNKGSSAAYTYNVGYTYYEDGSLNTLTYPSGDIVTYQVLGASRATQVTDSTNNYAASARYAPQGALASMTNGAAILTSNTYNNRLQPVLLSAGVNSQNPIFKLCYDFHLGAAVSSCGLNAYSTGDNGNVFQVIDKVDSTRSATFAYDPLNRIAQANTITTTGANCWGEVYTIDSWGNLTNRSGPPGMTGCSTEGLASPANVKNQLTGISHDAAGNVTNDGNGNQPTYDGENRIVTDQGVTYSYDADGTRMEKSSGTMYWTGPGGEYLSETNLSGVINEEYIFFNGTRIARVDHPTGAVHYYFSDHLGSASAITDASGNVQQRYYYYPYGGLQSSMGSDPNHYKFTGKERDSESNLDEFGARYYASSMGRFIIPDWAAKPTDVPYANFGNPQSLNLYSYVQNNPLSKTDPDGHDCQTIGQYTWCWNRSEFQSLRDAEDAHEAKHREDNKNNVDQPGWRKEERGYAAEVPVLEKRLSELEAKEKKGALTDTEKKEITQLREEHDTATAMTQGSEADRTAQRYYRDNQNWFLRLFIPSPDKDNKPRQQPPVKRERDPHRPDPPWNPRPTSMKPLDQ